MPLKEELEKKRKDIRSDSYAMSIGELISLYRDQEIDIHPEFQRFFRWKSSQKTRLIESILIDLPIPSIFVSQRDDGIWDVVDGLQRLSTIYEFTGILRGEDGRIRPCLTLEATDSLPSLINKKWEDENDEDNSFTQEQRLLFKRFKINVVILKQESDPTAKYELFQRLNTGGSVATEQEVRNCLLIMSNRDMYSWLFELSKNKDFRSCLSLSEKQSEEQYDMELLLRFIIFRGMDENALMSIKENDVSDFLTRKMLEIAENPSELDRDIEEAAFQMTFKALSESLGEDSFRKYNHDKQRFMGGLLVSAFEAVALGLGYNYKHFSSGEIDVRSKVKDLWEDPNFTEYLGGGRKTRIRLQNILPVGRNLFAQ